MSKSRRVLIAALAVFTAVSLVACSGGATTPSPSGSTPATSSAPASSAPGKAVEVSLGTPFDSKAPMVIAAQKFADDVLSQTNNALKINVFTNGATGTERDNIIATTTGEMEFSLAGTLTFDMYAPEYGFFVCPYLFKSNDHMKAVYESKIGQGFFDKLKQNGLDVLGICYKGARNTSSNNPINTPDDLKGIKIRMTENPTWVGVWGDALGTNPVPIPLGELYSSLQTGVVSASEGPYEQLATYKLFEVQKYLTNTEHIFDAGFIYASTDFMDTLPADQADLVRKIGKESMDYGSEQCAATASTFRQQLLDGGMQEINPDLAPFVAKVADITNKYFSEKWTASTYDEIMSFAK